MREIRTLLLAAVLVLGGAALLWGQQPAPDTTTISLDQARATALAQVPDNRGVKSVELKTKDGILVYEFDIETPGSGHREIRVDARTGAVVADKHEAGVVGAAASTAGAAAKTTVGATKRAGKAVAGAAKGAGKAVAGAAQNAADAADQVLTGDDLTKANPAISEAQATAIAQATVPDATVTRVQLTRRSGVLAWKVELKTTGPGHEEVRVDARTGKVLDQKHQD